eukprot:SAG31_NODE_22958_length_514_cov_0.978313_1_plen_90_part_01
MGSAPSLFPLSLLLIAPGLSSSGSNCNIELRFANTFGDHMVLQAGAAVSIWGHAPPGSEVVVRSSMSSQQTAARTDEGGTWHVALAAGPP